MSLDLAPSAKASVRLFASPPRRCAEKRVLPYFVPVGGFMLTPRYDDDPEAYGAAVKDMAECALETVPSSPPSPPSVVLYVVLSPR